MKGFTDNYLRVEVPADDNLANKVVMVKLVSKGDDDLVIGEVL